ncbi:MAG: CDP-diacylglycerol--serine O-phosphatidyltransferase [Candidatus Zixiibacteriota bacterium]|nr:MAG: CDP-diacylglycerol--serine O-phosphatidyltransferase [candidate division Zixibacteria bacterium]HDL04750.1 CDP-diacylglycerol--serine O-phosphatidyltransferase [candidate division Zixibacteria bacterium]
MQVGSLKGVVPSTFTMGNAVCGFLAILSAFEGDITTACWLIILSGFLDGLDGKVARLSGTTSEFGVQLDSLADFLSFGVAPAVIMYVVKLNSMGKWGWIISVVYIMAASYRLARFNLLAQTDEKKEFLGLPTPGAALLLVSYVIFSYHIWDGLEYSQYLVSMVILVAALMVSQIEYDAMPDNLNNRRNRIKLIFITIAAIAVLARPRLLIFPIFAIYVIIGLVREMYRFFYLGVGLVRKHQSRTLKNGENE